MLNFILAGRFDKTVLILNEIMQNYLTFVFVRGVGVIIIVVKVSMFLDKQKS